MASSAHDFNKLFLPSQNENYEYGNGFYKYAIESFSNFFHNIQEEMAANSTGTSKKKNLKTSISDETIKDQDSLKSTTINNETVNLLSYSNNNYVPRTLNQLKVQKPATSQKIYDNESTKEIESKVISTLEKKMQKLSIQKGNNVNNYGTKLRDNIVQRTESMFDSLPNDAFIAIKQSKPIHKIALFISFNYDLSNHFSHKECNAHGFRALFHDIQDHQNIAPIVKLVTNIVVNYWTYNCDISVFITSEPIRPISVVTALLKHLRVYFDRKTLKIIIIWFGVYKRSRPWINEQCRVAKATACIQGVETSDVVSQIMSYFDNGNKRDINGITTLFDEKKIACYHEFNNSYPAAMKVDDKIWLDAKKYFKVKKSEMDTVTLAEVNSDKENFLKSMLPAKEDNSESILRKALYNKFSQHSRLKLLLFSTRVSSIYFTQEKCQCNLYDNEYSKSETIVKGDQKIFKVKELFINILEEVRYSMMLEERKRIKSEYDGLVDREKKLFMFYLCKN